MKLIKSIYKAPVIMKDYWEEEGVTNVKICYQGQTFHGAALLSKEDKGFYSKKVGYNLALSRARIEALEYFYKQERDKFNVRKQFYQEVLGLGVKTPAEVDPLGAFNRNMMHCKYRADALKEALNKEKTTLHKYILGQDKAIESVKRFRRKADNN
mgnify:CR=1 FL=1